MYGDCLHKINPVTSGTRVSLIFDIYATPAARPHVCESFWSDDYNYNFRLPDAKLIRGVSEGIHQVILDGVHQALDENEEVVICLAHKYPLHQTTPAYLKGGDRALYDMLKGAFDTKVVACTVVHCSDEQRGRENVTAHLFTLFSPPSEESDASESETSDGSKHEGGEEGGTNAQPLGSHDIREELVSFLYLLRHKCSSNICSDRIPIHTAAGGRRKPRRCGGSDRRSGWRRQ
jgi:hypothetical protein